MTDMRMMYIKPTAQVVEAEAADMLAVSSVDYTDTEKASNEYESLAGKRRGTWGDLWHER